VTESTHWRARGQPRVAIVCVAFDDLQLGVGNAEEQVVAVVGKVELRAVRIGNVREKTGLVGIGCDVLWRPGRWWRAVQRSDRRR